MLLVIIMKLVSILLKGFDIRQVGANKTNIYTFSAMETDLNGARIPVELQTFNEEAKNKIAQHLNSQEELLIPFTEIKDFRGVNQYSINNIITHPDFIILSQI